MVDVGEQAIAQQIQQQGLQHGIQQALQQLVMFSQTAGTGTAAQLPPQAQFYLQNQVNCHLKLINAFHLIILSRA